MNSDAKQPSTPSTTPVMLAAAVSPMSTPATGENPNPQPAGLSWIPSFLKSSPLLTAEEADDLYFRGEYRQASEAFAVRFSKTQDAYDFISSIASGVRADNSKENLQKTLGTIENLLRSLSEAKYHIIKLNLITLCYKVEKALDLDTTKRLEQIRWLDPLFDLTEMDKISLEHYLQIIVAAFLKKNWHAWIKVAAEKTMYGKYFQTMGYFLQEETYALAYETALKEAKTENPLYQFLLGSELGKKGEIETALEYHQKAAVKNPISAYWLAIQYKNGLHHPKSGKVLLPADEKMMVHWLTVAAQKKHSEAMLCLAYHSINKPHAPAVKLKAFKYFEDAAIHSWSAEARGVLGLLIIKTKYKDFTLEQDTAFLCTLLENELVLKLLSQYSLPQAKQFLQEAECAPYLKTKEALAQLNQFFVEDKSRANTNVEVKEVKEVKIPAPPTKVLKFPECSELYFKGDYASAAQEFKKSWRSLPGGTILFLGYVASLLAIDDKKNKEDILKIILEFLDSSETESYVTFATKQRLYFLVETLSEELGEIKKMPLLEGCYQMMNPDKAPARLIAKGIIFPELARITGAKTSDLEKQLRWQEMKEAEHCNFLTYSAIRFIYAIDKTKNKECQTRVEKLLATCPNDLMLKTLQADLLLQDNKCEAAQIQKALAIYQETSVAGYAVADYSLWQIYQKGVKTSAGETVIPSDSKQELAFIQKAASNSYRMKAHYGMALAKTEPFKAWLLLQEAATAGYEQACFYVAFIVIFSRFGKQFYFVEESLEIIAKNPQVLLLLKDFNWDKVEALLKRALISDTLNILALKANIFRKFFNSQEKIRDSGKTFRELHAEAINGVSEALSVLGEFLLTLSNAEPRLYEESIAMLTKAAEKNHPRATYLLAYTYHKNLDATSSLDTKSKNYLMAALQLQDPSAYFEYYARTALNLQGYEGSPLEALGYLEKSVELGNVAAFKELALLITQTLFNMQQTQKVTLNTNTPSAVILQNQRVVKYLKNNYKMEHARLLFQRALGKEFNPEVAEMLGLIDLAYPQLKNASAIIKLPPARAHKLNLTKHESETLSSGAPASAISVIAAPDEKHSKKKKKNKTPGVDRTAKSKATPDAKENVQPQLTQQKAKKIPVVNLKQQTPARPKPMSLLDIKAADEKLAEKRGEQKELENALAALAKVEQEYENRQLEEEPQRAEENKKIAKIFKTSAKKNKKHQERLAESTALIEKVTQLLDTPAPPPAAEIKSEFSKIAEAKLSIFSANLKNLENSMFSLEQAKRIQEQEINKLSAAKQAFENATQSAEKATRTLKQKQLELNVAQKTLGDKVSDFSSEVKKFETTLNNAIQRKEALQAEFKDNLIKLETERLEAENKAKRLEEELRRSTEEKIAVDTQEKFKKDIAEMEVSRLAAQEATRKREGAKKTLEIHRALEIQNVLLSLKGKPPGEILAIILPKLHEIEKDTTVSELRNHLLAYKAAALAKDPNLVKYVKQFEQQFAPPTSLDAKTQPNPTFVAHQPAAEQTNIAPSICAAPAAAVVPASQPLVSVVMPPAPQPAVLVQIPGQPPVLYFQNHPVNQNVLFYNPELIPRSQPNSQFHPQQWTPQGKRT